MDVNATVFFGARSFEHEVSIVSAIVLKDLLQLSFVFIDKNGELYLIPHNSMQSQTFASGKYKNFPKLSLTHGGVVQEGMLRNKFIPIHVALNLVHGMEGEDGVLASLFEFYRIPFIGPRIHASVLSYNKGLTKLYAQSRNIQVLPYSIVKRDDIINADLPLILKPLRLGSSIGIAVVKDKKELEYACDVAFEFDDTVLIEPFKHAIKEYNLAGCLVGNTWHLSIIEEPQKNDILDFEKKYLDFSRSTSAKEAEIPPALRQKIIDSFQRIYKDCFEGALIRCDFFVENDTVYLNEINPVPGSLAHYLFPNFRDVFYALANSLPKYRNIPIDYLFINKIHAVKGK